MKNYLLIGAAFALLVNASSCSNDNTVDMPKTAEIQFANTLVAKLTKSVDPSFTTKTLGSFGVYGWVTKDGKTGKIFDDVTVKTTDQGASWTYDNTQYWIAGADYNFAAVAPQDNGTHDISDNAATAAIKGFTSDGATDLIYAKTGTIVGKASGNEKVQISFKHQLSKAKFTFTNSFPATSNITLKVTNVKITDAFKTADVALSTSEPAWSGHEGVLELDFGNAVDNNVDIIAAAASISSANERLIIPTPSSKEYAVSFNVTLYQGGVEIANYDMKSKIANIELKGGYAYNFTAKLSKDNVNEGNKLEPIVFGVSEIQNWTESSIDIN